MRSNFLFYLAMATNAITLLVTIGSMFTMFAPTQNLDGSYTGSDISTGMAPIGRLMLWLIPLILIVIMALGFWLRTKGKLLAANMLLCVPALPMMLGIVLWGGLAMTFILFGK